MFHIMKHAFIRLAPQGKAQLSGQLSGTVAENDDGRPFSPSAIYPRHTGQFLFNKDFMPTCTGPELSTFKQNSISRSLSRGLSLLLTFTGNIQYI